MLGLFSRKKKAQDTLRLSGFPGHIDMGKCLYLMAEKGMSIDLDLLDVTKRDYEQKLQSMSAFGKLPCLTVGGETYAGVAAVLPYLDVKGGGQSLVPKKAARLGEQNYWIEVGQLKVLPPLNILLQDRVLGQMISPDFQSEQQAVDDALNQLDRAFAIADEYLTDKYYFAGNFSLADVHWMSYLHFCSVCGEMDLVDKYSNLKQWFSRNQSRKTANKSTYLAFPDMEKIKGKALQNVA